MKKIFYTFILAVFAFQYLFVQAVYAVEISVEAPQEVLKQQEIFDFKVNIDTQGESISVQELYVTYDTQYVEFQEGGFLAGDFFDSVEYSKVEDGKIYVKATSTTPKSGSGLIAVVKLKIIATAPGSATLCAAEPITPAEPTPTPVVSTPTPTSLPKTGAIGNVLAYSSAGVSLIVLAGLVRKMLL
ncbi:MAG TPA: cohesin domain-containing protein [Candidatus Nitrosocosmicus sp.]|nr:cohesin domain-containing protein [Candidatus Nitrosocosmicus sp.]